MKNNTTELVFILDRSGSMASLEQDTIGGFNSMIKKQKENDGKCFVTTVLFDGVLETLHDRIPLNDIRPLTEKDYFARGCTALIDAMGETIEHIAKIHKYARKEDVPENTVFVITTDGFENASHKYSSDDVKKLVKKQKKEGWKFIFLGANIDAVETAKGFGISKETTVNYHADSVGTAHLYNAVSEAVCNVRTGAPMSSDWRKNIDNDFEKRKR